MGNHKKNNPRLGSTRAKLTFDDGFAEKPTHRIIGFTTEKDKGISMLELIQNKFNISEYEFKEAFKKKLSEWQKEFQEPTEYKKTYPKKFSLKDEKPQFTRDERGQIISPFGEKAKELRDDK